jgi:hypothetical protein
VLCGRFWGSITLSTRSEPAKTSKVYLLEMLHTTSKDQEKFLFLVEIFHIEFFIEKIDLDDHFTMLMLAEICIERTARKNEKKRERKEDLMCVSREDSSLRHSH